MKSDASASAIVAERRSVIAASTGAAGALLPTICANSGLHVPHTVDAPVFSASSAAEAQPDSMALVSCPRVTPVQLQTAAFAGQVAT